MPYLTSVEALTLFKKALLILKLIALDIKVAPVLCIPWKFFAEFKMEFLLLKLENFLTWFLIDWSCNQTLVVKEKRQQQCRGYF